MAEMQGIPVDEDSGKQIQTGHLVMLDFSGSIVGFVCLRGFTGIDMRVCC